MNLVHEVVHKSLMITTFVAVMMLLVEYLNVQTRGVLIVALDGSRARQLLVGAALGAIPGCLGAYAVVALYAHRKVSLGTLVAAMIATSGDETFVMLALFPGTAVLLTLGLAGLGVVAGALTDRLMPARWLPTASPDCCGLEVHDEDDCQCFPRGQLAQQWRPPSAYRATLVVALALVLLAVLAGHLGPAAWDWKRITLTSLIGAGLFVTATVPDHFLEEHLWRHVAQHHVPRIFLWTTGALAALVLLNHLVDLDALVAENPWHVLGTAAAIGILPESGPHLVFVSLFDRGAAPLSILVASSVVQDGHGMLPLLSTSTRAFLLVKSINLLVGVAVGAALLAAGT